MGAHGLPDAEVAAIKEVVETWTHALVAQDFDNWVTYWAEDGVLGLPPKVVQERLGHSSIVMTMDVYRHLFPGNDDTEALAAAERALLSAV